MVQIMEFRCFACYFYCAYYNPRKISNGTISFITKLYKKISDGRSVSTAAAVLNIIKTNVGTGVYGLPTAVANAGLGLGVGAMVFINTITIHSMLLLVSF